MVEKMKVVQARAMTLTPNPSRALTLTLILTLTLAPLRSSPENARIRRSIPHSPSKRACVALSPSHVPTATPEPHPTAPSQAKAGDAGLCEKRMEELVCEGECAGLRAEVAAFQAWLAELQPAAAPAGR